MGKTSVAAGLEPGVASLVSSIHTRAALTHFCLTQNWVRGGAKVGSTSGCNEWAGMRAEADPNL